MQKKYQVFISSTYSDLVVERNELIKAILDLGHIPAGMELFGAADEEQFAYIKRVIDECDYYVLIVAGRYGSTDQDGVAYTEKEFDYAVATGMTVLAFIHGSPSALAVSRVDTDPKQVLCLEAFKQKVKTGRLVSFWDDLKDLKSAAIIALNKAFGQKPGIGWIRGNAAASEDLLNRINFLSEQNEVLRAENIRFKSQAQPLIDDIADIGDQVELQFQYENFDDLLERGTTVLSWGEVFCIIGQSFSAPAAPKQIDACIGVWLTQEGPGPVQDVYSFTLFDSSRGKILMQMQGYGFLAPNSVAHSDEAEAGMFVLTERGQRTLMEMLVARKK